jgi:hypothetical protein
MFFGGGANSSFFNQKNGGKCLSSVNSTKFANMKKVKNKNKNKKSVGI